MRPAIKIGLFSAVAAGVLLAWVLREQLGLAQFAPGAMRVGANALNKRYGLDDLLAQSMHFPDIADAAKAAPPYKINICGLDSVQVDPAVEQKPKAIQELDKQGELLLTQHFERLRNSSDDVLRALALRAGATKDPNDLDRLIALGIQTKDPVAYMVALKGCTYVDGPSLCTLLHPIVLTEIDADNANSWITLAAYEQNITHAEAATAAFTRAGQATRHDSYYAAITQRLLASAELDQKEPLAQLQLDTGLVGIVSAIHLSEYAMISRYCDKQITDANPARHEQCTAVANLIEKSNSLVEASVGLTVKERVAPSAALLTMAQEQRDALKAAYTLTLNPTKDLPKEDAEFSCEMAKRMRAHVHDIGAIGEMGIVRRELLARELTTEKLAQIHRNQADSSH